MIQKRHFNLLHSDINIIVTSWQQNKTTKTTYVMLSSETCSFSIYSRRLHIRAFPQSTSLWDTDVMFFYVCISTKGASTLVWYWNGVCDIIYREELSSHYSQIILQSSISLQRMEYWVAYFHLGHYSQMPHVAHLLKSHNIPGSVLNTYFKDNTALFMHTYCK